MDDWPSTTDTYAKPPSPGARSASGRAISRKLSDAARFGLARVGDAEPGEGRAGGEPGGCLPDAGGEQRGVGAAGGGRARAGERLAPPLSWPAPSRGRL